MNICLKCLRKNNVCFCQHIFPVDTQTRFLIFMHPMEFRKEKNGTGRMTHLMLPNSSIHVGISADELPSFKREILDEDYRTFVLYPGSDALNLSQNECPPLGFKKLQLIIIDSTWPCAKKMMKNSLILQDLPRVSMNVNKVSDFKIKHQPDPNCLSSIEAVECVLHELKRLKIESDQLSLSRFLDAFEFMNKKQLDFASSSLPGYRRKPFCPPDQRRISEKWKHRNLFFKTQES